MLKQIRSSLKKAANPRQAKNFQRFFKTGCGEYGEGDIFVGVSVPQLRKLAVKHHPTNLTDLKNLLRSHIHEERHLALIFLVMQYQQTQGKKKKQLFDFYVRNRKYVNNWDLVDQTAHQIIGDYLKDKDRSLLLRFSKSGNLWERRISIVATFKYISQGRPEWTFKIAEILLGDDHDLIHKAVGWMLREVGKRCSVAELENFLKKHLPYMSRTTLRYAIEHFPEPKRRKYLNIKAQGV